ncbi:MAG: ABC transporter ATP-binding protein [Hyphomicrobium sp.]
MSKTFSPFSVSSSRQMPSQSPLIRFENITKRFHEKAALQSFNLDIEDGEFFAFLGPSGCGKTTLLRMLAGFENPTEGRILLEGKDITALPAHQRSTITMVFQSYALFPHMTVERNIAFGLHQDKMPSFDIKVRVQEAMRMLQIETLANRKPHQLSGGQQQRVALARAIAKKPKILLLDEPLTALDKRLRAQAQSDLLELQKKTNATFIIVTHDQEEAMILANRIAVLDHGYLRQVGTPSEIYNSPTSRHVAQFFGEVNLFEGEVTTVDNGVHEIFCPSLSATVKVISEEPFSQGQKVTVVLRPEKITLSKQSQGIQFNSLKAKLVKISYLGSISYYHFSVASQGDIKVLHQNTQNNSKDPVINIGEEIWLIWSQNEGRLLHE